MPKKNPNAGAKPGVKKTDEHKRKISESMKGKQNRLGTKWTEEQRVKMMEIFARKREEKKERK